jgi:hypothetical protein
MSRHTYLFLDHIGTLLSGVLVGLLGIFFLSGEAVRACKRWRVFGKLPKTTGQRLMLRRTQTALCDRDSSVNCGAELLWAQRFGYVFEETGLRASLQVGG